ncbi:discoidin domain-containing protein [Kitasatospora sp. NPDC097643]|uniref:discoidin domain-containing protein n=1 Tax=Kitasatospora sp. NPDC097643 TaxID=3157230 RepID=UPI00331A6A5E
MPHSPEPTGQRVLIRILVVLLFPVWAPALLLCQLLTGVLALLAFPAELVLLTLYQLVGLLWLPVTDRPELGADPAYLAHFRRGLWDDLGREWRWFRAEQTEHRRAFLLRLDHWFRGGRRANWCALGYPVAFLMLRLTVPFAVLLRAVALLAHLPAVLLLWAGWQLARIAVVVADRAHQLLPRGSTRCPHPGCEQLVRRPVHRCPACGQEHRDLRSGRYGLIRRACRCGARLPASPLFGAHRLDAHCPHCTRRLPRRWARNRIRTVVIAGGPSADRSAVQALALDQLDDLAAASGGHFRTDEPAGRTAELTGLRGRATLLAVLAPKGDVYTDQDRIDHAGLLDHADGVVLVLDPLAIEDVRRAGGGPARPLGEDSPDTLGRVLLKLKEPARRRTRRIVLLLDRPERLPAELAPLGTAPDQISDWLGHYASNLHSLLGQSGARVRYGAVGGAGEPDDPRPLARLLLWAGGRPAERRRLPRPPVHRPSASTRLSRRLHRAHRAAGAKSSPRLDLLTDVGLDYPTRRPDGWIPAGRRHGNPVSLRASRALLSAALAAVLVLPVFTPLPSFDPGGIWTAIDRQFHRLDKSTREIDAADATRALSWNPHASAGYVYTPHNEVALEPDLVLVEPASLKEAERYWTTFASSAHENWLAVDLGGPVPVTRVTVEFAWGELSPAFVPVNSPGYFKATIRPPAAYRLDYRLGADWKPLAQSAPSGRDVRLPTPVTTDAVRVVLPGNPDQQNAYGIKRVRVWTADSTALSLAPDGTVSDTAPAPVRLRIKNTFAHDLSIQVAEPQLPPGWTLQTPAKPSPPPTTIGGGDGLTLDWLVAPPGRPTTGSPGPIDFSVRITDDGRTATAYCRAVLDPDREHSAVYHLLPTACGSKTRTPVPDKTEGFTPTPAP